jgi:hypothetical protein
MARISHQFRPLLRYVLDLYLNLFEIILSYHYRHLNYKQNAFTTNLAYPETITLSYDRSAPRNRKWDAVRWVQV